MHTSVRSDYLHCSGTTSLETSRTAVYGPVRTVVWQGSAGDCRPYADQTGISDTCLRSRHFCNLPPSPIADFPFSSSPLLACFCPQCRPKNNYKEIFMRSAQSKETKPS
jgi:hypothetical protein